MSSKRKRSGCVTIGCVWNVIESCEGSTSSLEKMARFFLVARYRYKKNFNLEAEKEDIKTEVESFNTRIVSGPSLYDVYEVPDHIFKLADEIKKEKFPQKFFERLWNEWQQVEEKKMREKIYKKTQLVQEKERSAHP